MAHSLAKTETPSFELGDLGDQQYRLTQSLPLSMAYGESGYTLTEPRSGVFAYDRDLTTAFQKLQRALVDQFEFLTSHEGTLSPQLRRELEFLRQVIIGK